ncbi:hypothetical protein [Rhodococcus qingshengii]|uniref:hypothetical protein n=1 Tax=Rhodococcus qingshengii TaxID=334542 RepID=UPI0013154B66|nr:hypothetical protein [Rhodococcus qingshengii]
MQLPAPDTGLSSFPVSDSATVSMPGPDSGAITFPPAPIPIVVITAVTVVDVETSVETLTVPWYVVETVVDVATGVEVLASVTVEAETTVDVETTAIQIFDSVTAETVVDVETSATASVSTAVAAETTVDVVTEVLLGTQRAIVTANTTVDVEVEVISIPVTSFTANTTVDVTTSATAVPVGVVTAETVVDVQTSGLITSFTPSGMVKGSDSNITSTTAALVTGMVANPNLPGSTVTSDALVSAFAGPVRVGFALHAVTSGGADGRAAVFKNGVQVGATFSLYVPYNGPAVITGSVSTTVAIGDQITLRFWAASAAYAMTIKGTTTRLNMAEGSSVTVGGAVASTYTPAVGWSDVPLVADSGTTLSGNAILVPVANPNAILAANIDINSGSAMAVRFLVNGTVVYTGPTAPAYEARAVGSVGYALAAGDLVSMQVQRISTFATSVYAGSKFTVI